MLTSKKNGPRVAIVVPTYNEAENLPVLVERLFAVVTADLNIYVVDDGSPDGTAAVARQLSEKHDNRIEIISRERKLGLGTAYITGFTRALEDDPDHIVQMDADLSHAPEEVPAMLEKLGEADVVVGSRYTAGGGVAPRWSANRRRLSAFGNYSIRLVTGLAVKDVTSGFKAFRREALRALDISIIECRGFGFQAETAYWCQANGMKIVEHPIIFEERAMGTSKMSVRIIIEAIGKLSLLRLKEMFRSHKTETPV